MAAKQRDRLNRQFDRLQRSVPLSRGFLDWARKPSSRILRIPLGILLIFGGIFSFLPILGVWMLPLGLLLLALDLPILQGPLNNAILRGQRWWQNFRRKRAEKKRAKE
jgi:hypothetical protein